MANIFAHLSSLSRIIERELGALNISKNDLNFHIEIDYIRN